MTVFCTFSTAVWGFPWLHRARYRMGQFPKAVVYSSCLWMRFRNQIHSCVAAFAPTKFFSLFFVTFYVILLGWLSRIQQITFEEKFNYCIFATGQTSRSVASSRSSKAAFIKYHIYAWISPAIIVIISFALDTSDAAFIGYGKLSIY